MGCPGDPFRSVDPILAAQLDQMSGDPSCGGSAGYLEPKQQGWAGNPTIGLPPIAGGSGTNPLPSLPSNPAQSGMPPIGAGSVFDPICDILPSPAKEYCKAGAGVVTTLTGGSSSPLAPAGGSSSPGCPSGYVLQNGRCVKSGIDQYIPGTIGTLTDYGPAVMGAFGKPALTPKQRGQIMRKDGKMYPILGCPRGMVLGADELCYQKGSITNRERAHPRGHRPLITGGEMHAFSVAKAASKKLRKLANRFAPVHHRAPKRKK